MQYILLLLLICVPAPKHPATPKVSPLVGAWAIDWGQCKQTTFFRPDGTCYSPEFGNGTWSEDAEGTIWFSERDGRNQYLMRIDLLDGEGSGWHRCADGQIGNAVEVRIRRGERLPEPRVVE